MNKNLPILAAILALSACSVDQAPAPYVEKGGERFTKRAGYAAPVVQKSEIVRTQNFTSGGPANANENVDYIDGGNSSIQQSTLPPLSRNDEVIDFAQTKSRNQIAFEQPSAQNPVFRSDVIRTVRPKPVMDAEPTPAVDDAKSANKASGYLDLSGVNALKSGQIQAATLGNISPRAKPVMDEEPTPAAVVAKVEPAVAASVAPVATAAAKVEKIEMPKMPEAPAPAKIEPAPVTVAASVEPAKKVEAAPVKAAEVLAPAPTGQFIRPVGGKIIGKFGNTSEGTFNDGIKIRAAKGADVQAAADGEVVYSGNQLQGYGNMIIVRHSNGYLTAYAHLEDLPQKKGARVSQGQVIGHVGDTGNVDEPQLHFGVREGREPIDPQKFLK